MIGLLLTNSEAELLYKVLVMRTPKNGVEAGDKGSLLDKFSKGFNDPSYAKFTSRRKF